MSINTEQFAAANKAAVDSLLSVANAALASAERIATLNLETARNAIEDSAANKDVQEALAIQASLTQPNIDKAVAYGRSVAAISSEAQEQLSKVVEAQFGDFQKSVASLLDKAAKSAPAGSEVAVAAVQSAIAAATSAFDNARKSAQQMTALAQNNIAAAASATAKAAKKAK